MPNDTLNKVADKCGYSINDLEDMWSKAKTAAKEYASEDSDKFFQVTMGVFKNMLSSTCLSKLGWEKKESKDRKHNLIFFGD